MNSRPRWLVTVACSGLLAASACFEDPVSSLDDDEDDEEEETRGDGDGDPGDGDGEPGDGDGDHHGDGDGDGDGCGPGETLCGGAVCVNLETDSANCGDCGNPCPPLTACGEGMCRPEKYVFVTDAKYPGNLGGLEADAICQTAATMASLPNGLYRAWLSDANQSPADWLVTDGVYFTRQGPIVAYSWDDLRDGMLESPINRTEFGEMVGSTPACNNAVPFAVWTGTGADGSSAPPDCNGWSSVQDSAMGRVGNAAAIDPTWSGSDCTISCATELPIYCVQQ